METSKAKPGLAILIGQALAKKGKAKSPVLGAEEDDEMMEDHSEHLVAIAKDLIDAVHSKDAEAVAELLEEAFEVCDAAPHVEGPHEEE